MLRELYRSVEPEDQEVFICLDKPEPNPRRGYCLDDEEQWREDAPRHIRRIKNEIRKLRQNSNPAKIFHPSISISENMYSQTVPKNNP